MTVLSVGEGQQFTRLSDAIASSRDGDLVQVQSGVYIDDFATINTKITIEAVGGRVWLLAHSAPPNGKAVLVTQTDVTLKGIEISGARVDDRNGAAIRHENGKLTLDKVYFHDNQNGVLAGDNPNSSVTITGSEFAGNGDGDGQSHGIYANKIANLTIRDSFFHDTKVGHEIKSRALVTVIEDSRIVNGPNGSASYNIDLPNGGDATVRGNTIEKGPRAENPHTIHFGGEGARHPSSSLLVTDNTIVNDRDGGRLILNQTDVPVNVTGNDLFRFDSNDLLRGPGTASGNTVLGSRPSVDLTPFEHGSFPPVVSPAGPDTLVVRLSGDAYQGNAQFIVRVDGKTLGPVVQEVTALRKDGQSQEFTFKGDFGPGTHKVSVSFLTDAYGGTAASDRNLYIEGVSLNGQAIPDATASMFSVGTSVFTTTALPTSAPPVIGSNGGGSAATVSIAENTTAVTTVVARDPNGTALLYGLAGGADRALFAIDGATGALTFLAAPDAENPADADRDGTYEVTVVADNGPSEDRQVLSVVVTNVNDNAPVAMVPLPGQAGTKGVAFNYALPAGTFTDADADALSYTATGLPDGLVISNVGVISGTPTTAGTFNASIFASDGRVGTPTSLALMVAPGQTAPSGTTQAIGAGSDALVLRLQQDAYQGNAQYTVKVDGVQVGGVLTASATRASGLFDTLTVQGEFAAGPHRAEVTFLNDRYDGTAATDRNLFVASGAYNGDAVPLSARQLLSNGPAFIDFRDEPTVGAGSDALVLRLQQDAYQGNAQYTVKVDGTQIGGVLTAAATRASGLFDTLIVRGEFAAGPHRAEVTFLNDRYDGTAATDRNLFVASGTYNGSGVAAAQTALFSTGPASFGFTDIG